MKKLKKKNKWMTLSERLVSLSHSSLRIIASTKWDIWVRK